MFRRKLLAVAYCAIALCVLCVPDAVRADFLAASDLTDQVLRFSDSGVPKGAFVTAGSGGLNSTRSMAWGPDGNLYVAGNDRVNRYDGTTGAFIDTTLALNGRNLFGIHFLPSGELLVSAQNPNQILRANVTTKSVTAAVSLPDSAGKMIGTPDGNVVIGVVSGGPSTVIRKLNLSNNQLSVFASGGGINGVFGFDYGPDGMLYGANLYGDYGIYRINPVTGQVLGKFVDPQFVAASDVLFAPGERMWVASVLNSSINRFGAIDGILQASISSPSSNYDLLYVPEPASAAMLFTVLLCARRRVGKTSI